MRSILLTTLFFLSFATLTKAQTNVYVPFPDSGAKWNGEYDYCMGCNGEPNPTIYNFGFYFRETHDTVINTLTYHLINFANTWVSYYLEFEPGTSWAQNFGPPFSEETVGALLEDSLHRIYYRSFTSGIDYSGEYPFSPPDTFPIDSDILLYDFSLNVGDTTPAKMYQVDSTFITGYDSVQIGNSYRKAFDVKDTIAIGYYGEYYAGTDAWVEGVGSIGLGLLGSTYLNIFIRGEGGGNPPYLKCFSINNQVLYPQNHQGGCDTIIIADINTPTSQKLSMKVFPNPASDELFLKFSQNFIPTEITVYNAIGQQINLPYNTAIDKSLNIENLPAGLYIIKATDDNSVLTEAFIKE